MTREHFSAYILKKKGDCYLTEDDRWKSFCNTTRHLTSLELVKEIKRKSRAKINVVAVYDTYEGFNSITKYERVERVIEIEED